MDRNDLQKKLFHEICKISEGRNETRHRIKPGDAEGKRILQKLEKFALVCLPPECKNEELFTIRVSKGFGGLPRVLWIAVTPRGRRVSNSPSVAICFGAKGEGAVVGAMDSSSTPQWFALRKKRSTNPDMAVDVNGGRPNVNYNDKFINPAEFLAGSDLVELSNHLDESISLLVEFMKERYGVNAL